MLNITRLNDAFTDYINAGIFTALKNEIGNDLPWASDTSVNDISLNIIYHGNHSGQKITSPMIDIFLDVEPYTGKLTADDLKKLATAIWSMYKIPWSKWWQIHLADYNLIENYDRTETHTGTDTETQTPTNWKEVKSGTDTATETPTNWKETVQGAKSDNEVSQDSKIYGFNSASGVNSDSVVTASKNKQETERTGTYQNEMAYNSEVERQGSFETELEHNTEVHTHGNIGVTTAQQMLTQEIELWKWNYFESVMADIDSVLTIKIY